jgi:prophage regulatory protein
MNTSSANQLIRIQEVSNLVSLGKSTIRLWVAQGKFPPPITLSPTIKVWKPQDIQQWIEARYEKQVLP